MVAHAGLSPKVECDCPVRVARAVVIAPCVNAIIREALRHLLGNNPISSMPKDLDRLWKRTAKEERVLRSSSCPGDDGEPDKRVHFPTPLFEATRISENENVKTSKIC
jgi:hypothetical protein